MVFIVIYSSVRIFNDRIWTSSFHTEVKPDASNPSELSKVKANLDHLNTAIQDQGRQIAGLETEMDPKKSEMKNELELQIQNVDRSSEAAESSRVWRPAKHMPMRSFH